MAKELFNVLVGVDMECKQRLKRPEISCMSARSLFVSFSEKVPFMWNCKYTATHVERPRRDR